MSGKAWWKLDDSAYEEYRKEYFPSFGGTYPGPNIFFKRFKLGVTALVVVTSILLPIRVYLGRPLIADLSKTDACECQCCEGKR